MSRPKSAGTMSTALLFTLDLMQVLGPVTARRMFGGYGLFLDGLMIALWAGETLYFKTDAQSVTTYMARQLQPFTYVRQGKRCALSYYEAPAEVFDELEQMVAWGNAAVEAALRSR